MSAAPKMTVRQIAEAAGCNHKTVRDVANRLYPEMAHNGVRHEYDAAQSYAIMAELPKRNMVGASGASQKREGQLPENGKVAKLPSGAQLNALRRIYPLPELMDRLDFVLGYPVKTSKVYSLPAPDATPVDHALASAGLKALGVAGKLPPAAWDKARRVAIAAGSKVLADEAARLAADGQQGRLL
jgi:hypothetical protein